MRLWEGSRETSTPFNAFTPAENKSTLGKGGRVVLGFSQGSRCFSSGFLLFRGSEEEELPNVRARNGHAPAARHFHVQLRGATLKSQPPNLTGVLSSLKGHQHLIEDWFRQNPDLRSPGDHFCCTYPPW